MTNFEFGGLQESIILKEKNGIGIIHRCPEERHDLLQLVYPEVNF